MSIERYQYQAHVEPLAPLAAGETITSDKWGPSLPSRRRVARVLTAAVIASTFVAEAPLEAVPPPPAPSLDGWVVPVAEPRRDVLRPVNEGFVVADPTVPAPVVIIDSDVDAWMPPLSEPQRYLIGSPGFSPARRLRSGLFVIDPIPQPGLGVVDMSTYPDPQVPQPPPVLSVADRSFAVGPVIPVVSLPSTGEIEWFVPLAEPRRPLSGSTGLKPASVHGPMSSVTGTGPNVRRIPVEETFPWQRPVTSITATPAVGPSKGDRYVVGGSATGVWAGHDDDIAWFDGLNWQFDTPTDGWFVYNRGDNLLYLFDGAAWTNVY